MLLVGILLLMLVRLVTSKTEMHSPVYLQPRYIRYCGGPPHQNILSCSLVNFLCLSELALLGGNSCSACDKSAADLVSVMGHFPLTQELV